jgi:hypothetical protein
MSFEGNEATSVGAKGLRRVSIGSAFGLAAGVFGLGLPVALILLASWMPGTSFLTGSQLIEATAGLALIGAALFAVSLTIFQFGFKTLREVDRRFWTASILCAVGTVGVLLLLVPIALAFASSNAIADCVQGAPSHTLACLGSVAPLASYWAIAAFWCAWLGGLGIIVGISLAGRLYRQDWLYAGAALYSLLLLGLLSPAIGLLLPIYALSYPLLAAPLLVMVAPALIFPGCGRALQRA